MIDMNVCFAVTYSLQYIKHSKISNLILKTRKFISLSDKIYSSEINTGEMNRHQITKNATMYNIPEYHLHFGGVL